MIGIGKVVARKYRVDSLIGTGGMANVYKARCTYLNRYVAIKVLKDEFKNDEDFLKRFMKRGWKEKADG